LGAELRVGEQERGVEVADEQPLGEAERLRAGEEQLLGLLLLLGELVFRHRHDGPPAVRRGEAGGASRRACPGGLQTAGTSWRAAARLHSSLACTFASRIV